MTLNGINVSDGFIFCLSGVLGLHWWLLNELDRIILEEHDTENDQTRVWSITTRMDQLVRANNGVSSCKRPSAWARPPLAFNPLKVAMNWYSGVKSRLLFQVRSIHGLLFFSGCLGLVVGRWAPVRGADGTASSGWCDAGLHKSVTVNGFLLSLALWWCLSLFLSLFPSLFPSVDGFFALQKGNTCSRA